MILEEEISSRLGKLSKKQGNTQGNSFFSMRNPLATYTPCSSSNAEEDGVCLAGPVCSFYGGRAVQFLPSKNNYEKTTLLRISVIFYRLVAIVGEHRRVASVSIFIKITIRFRKNLTSVSLETYQTRSPNAALWLRSTTRIGKLQQQSVRRALAV